MSDRLRALRVLIRHRDPPAITGHVDAGGLWFIDGRDDEISVSGGENTGKLLKNALAESQG